MLYHVDKSTVTTKNRSSGADETKRHFTYHSPLHGVPKLIVLSLLSEKKSGVLGASGLEFINLGESNKEGIAREESNLVYLMGFAERSESNPSGGVNAPLPYLPNVEMLSKEDQDELLYGVEDATSPLTHNIEMVERNVANNTWRHGAYNTGQLLLYDVLDATDRTPTTHARQVLSDQER